MGLIQRRTLLRLAVAGALCPGLSIRANAHVAGAAPFDPPATPLRYARSLVRELRGGETIAVTRDFSVRFVPLPESGYEVEGNQVWVEVAAPEKMAPFVELERSRVETGVFPLRLGTRGLIERGPEFAPSQLLDRAVAEARRLMEKGVTAAPAEAENFLQLVHRAGATLAAHLPDDLFAPFGHSRTERREITLPGGQSGEIEIRFTADADPRTGLMSHAIREIVTTIGPDRRTTQERWTLASF
ncbi:MAG: hypothetical protein ACO1OD_04805 [Croceibacterium sp.]